MAPRTLSLALVALCALATCITPEYHCRIICGAAPNECPAEFTCDRASNRCAHVQRGDTCPLPPGIDAGPPPAENPAELCYAGNCLPLSPEMRAALVLWLDPSNLPSADTAVTRWPDRSREGNDAVPVVGLAPPRSRGDGLRFVPGMNGPLFLTDDPSLDFGAGDFTVLMVARTSQLPSCFFSKASFDRMDPRGVILGWNYAPELARPIYRAALNATILASMGVLLNDLHPHLIVLRRAGEAAEARIDGAATATAVIPAGQSVSTREHAFIGSCGETGAPIDSIHAVIVFRGSIPASDLVRLEAFLRGLFPAG